MKQKQDAGFRCQSVGQWSAIFRIALGLALLAPVGVLADSTDVCLSALNAPSESFTATAQSVIKGTPKIGAYGLIRIAHSGAQDSRLSLVADANAGWLATSFRDVTGKSLPDAKQNDVKAYLRTLSAAELGRLAGPRLHTYGAENRTLQRDSSVYFLEELLADGKRKDLALALIGQLLFETHAKKESRIVEVQVGKAKKYGILLGGKQPELLVPGICEGGPCGEDFSAVSLEVAPNPPPSSSKDQKQFSIFDLNGQSHVVQITGRSPAERLFKTDQELINKAGAEDLVPLEMYFFSLFHPGGSTGIRVGDTLFHFGSEGWHIATGSEKIKGYLFSNPFTRNMYKTYAGLKMPPYTVGVTMMVPKKNVEALIKRIQEQAAAPEGERLAFEYFRQNCNQVPLCALRDSGLAMGSASGYNGFSSTMTLREIFLKPPFPLRSTNVYPLPGTEITEAEYRDLFPPLLYRYHTSRNDRALLHWDLAAARRYQEATLLASLRAEPAAPDQLFEALQTRGIVDDRAEFDGILQQSLNTGLITVGAEAVGITEQGRERLRERSVDYKLD